MDDVFFVCGDMVSVLVIRAFGELLVCEAENLRDLTGVNVRDLE